MKRLGFSLIEISISLVILGLLVGAIVTGQSLIRASELRSVSAEYNLYQSAVHTFKGKYLALPGDMTTATALWGDNATHCSDSHIDSIPGTCNGNGDNKVSQTATAGDEPSEMFMFWNQLAYSGIITEHYTGLSGNTSNWTAIAGENVPASKLSGGAWTAYHSNTANAGFATVNWDIIYNNHFVFGSSTSTISNGAIITPEEAWKIDTKMDDGLPAAGNVLSVGWNDICSSADVGSSANDNFASSYRVTSSDIECALAFPNSF